MIGVLIHMGVKMASYDDEFEEEYEDEVAMEEEEE